jgi:hypothetical protein
MQNITPEWSPDTERIVRILTDLYQIAAPINNCATPENGYEQPDGVKQPFSNRHRLGGVKTASETPRRWQSSMTISVPNQFCGFQISSRSCDLAVEGLSKMSIPKLTYG